MPVSQTSGYDLHSDMNKMADGKHTVDMKLLQLT